MIPKTKLIACFILWICMWGECYGYGQLIEPPSRSSMWRFGFNSTPNFEDANINCGGWFRRYGLNDGKCGVCGDAWDIPRPRPNEDGGLYGKGIIVRHYRHNESNLTVRVNMMEANRGGYFEVRICASQVAHRRPDREVTQSCLNENLLHRIEDADDPFFQETRFYPNNIKKVYEINYIIPNVVCDRCVLQWTYITKPIWPVCNEDSVKGSRSDVEKGCPIEEFRACSDISISKK